MMCYAIGPFLRKRGREGGSGGVVSGGVGSGGSGSGE